MRRSRSSPHPSSTRSVAGRSWRWRRTSVRGMVEGKWASPHDALLANKVAYVLCGGKVAAGTLLSEQAYLDLEFEAFLSLCGEEKSLARIEHMLKNGKPLRN